MPTWRIPGATYLARGRHVALKFLFPLPLIFFTHARTSILPGVVRRWPAARYRQRTEPSVIAAGMEKEQEKTSTLESEKELQQNQRNQRGEEGKVSEESQEKEQEKPQLNWLISESSESDEEPKPELHHLEEEENKLSEERPEPEQNDSVSIDPKRRSASSGSHLSSDESSLSHASSPQLPPQSQPSYDVALPPAGVDVKVRSRSLESGSVFR